MLIHCLLCDPAERGPLFLLPRITFLFRRRSNQAPQSLYDWEQALPPPGNRPERHSRSSVALFSGRARLIVADSRVCSHIMKCYGGQ